MARKGAKRIILASRSSQASGIVQTLIQDLGNEGTEVVVRPCDVAKQEDVERVVAEAPDSFPIRGVIHSAMVLHVSSSGINSIEDESLTLRHRISYLRR